MSTVEEVVRDAIRLYGQGRIDEAKGRVLSAWMTLVAEGGPMTMPIHADDLKREGVTAKEFAKLMKDSGIPLAPPG